MTLVELTKVVEDGKPISIVLERKEVRAIFPTPGGSSTEDQLLTYCWKHRLSFRLVGNRYLFTRGIPGAIVEAMVRELQGGKPKS